MMVTGGVLALAGIVKGFLRVGDLCGSPFRPDSLAAEIYDTLEGSFGGAAAECESKISGSLVWVIALIGLGVILFAVGMIMRTIAKNRPAGTGTPGTAQQGIGSQIEELSRLRDQGLITPEEYELKKSELLSRM